MTETLKYIYHLFPFEFWEVVALIGFVVFTILYMLVSVAIAYYFDDGGKNG